MGRKSIRRRRVVRRPRMQNQLMLENIPLENLPVDKLDDLIASLARLASERFDMRALLQLHDFNHLAHVVVADKAGGTLPLHFMDASSSGSSTCSIPLQQLNPISFTELQVGEVHHGRVVYGTLCVEAFRRSTIMTLLEDDNGLAVRLAIYDTAPSQSANMKKLYPRGARVAVREPFIMRAADGSILIWVDNPANVHKLVTEEMLLRVNVQEVRKRGNMWFREKNWDAAVENYTKCIDATHLQLKERVLNDDQNISTSLLHAYSNRAEAWLQLKEFKRALEDSDEALGIDPNDLKSLYRKGRALLGLRQYAIACESLEKADRVSAGNKEIKDILRQAKTLHAQSRNGKYDISAYLLGRCPSPPEVADFVGPVEIHTTKDCRGRGLYATEDIATGQLLLVSNAVAVVYDDRQSALPMFLNYRGKILTASREDLVAAVVCAARKSERLLQQLYSLDVSSPTESLHAPAMDLFRSDDEMSHGKKNENFEVDVNRLRDVISRNTFGVVYEPGLCHAGHKYFRGLWLLPSFINHSCLPNSTRLQVGSAMFIHASKPVQRGEEITISYFDALVPLPQRQANCEDWGFECKCERCGLEQSLRPLLEPITREFGKLLGKAMEEINAATCLQLQPFDTDRPAFAQFAKFFVRVEEIIRNSPELKTEEEKKWVRASFVSAYFAGTQSNVFFSTTLEDCVPSGKEIVETIQSTVPGDIRTLIMVAKHLKEAKRWMRGGNEASITRTVSEQAREACIRVFGRHCEHVFEELVFQYSNHQMFY